MREGDEMQRMKQKNRTGLVDLTRTAFPRKRSSMTLRSKASASCSRADQRVLNKKDKSMRMGSQTKEKKGVETTCRHEHQ